MAQCLGIHTKESNLDPTEDITFSHHISLDVSWLQHLLRVSLFLTSFSFFFFSSFFRFTYLFLDLVSLHCCAQTSVVTGGMGGLLFLAMHRLLIAVVSLVAEHGL